jgi:hypothetical protein
MIFIFEDPGKKEGCNDKSEATEGNDLNRAGLIYF